MFPEKGHWILFWIVLDTDQFKLSLLNTMSEWLSFSAYFNIKIS